MDKKTREKKVPKCPECKRPLPEPYQKQNILWLIPYCKTCNRPLLP